MKCQQNICHDVVIQLLFSFSPLLFSLQSKECGFFFKEKIIPFFEEAYVDIFVFPFSKNYQIHDKAVWSLFIPFSLLICWHLLRELLEKMMKPESHARMRRIMELSRIN